MLAPKNKPSDQEFEDRLYPDIPNYVATDAAFRAAVEVGLADIKAGRTEPFAPFAAELRQAFDEG